MRVLRVSHSAVVDAWRERERALARRGVDVRLCSARAWDEGGATVPLAPRPGEPVRGVRTWGSHPALFVYDPRPLWRALGERWDVIDIHEEPFALATAEILLLRACRRRRAPYVLYSAQNIAKRYPVPFRWFERWALRGASGLSVCNDAAGVICVDKGFPGAPRTIPLGIDPQVWTPAPEPAPATVVGYAGRLAPHKGVGVLLEALAATPRLRLRIAGAGPDAAALAERAAAPDLAGRVEFVGSLDAAGLADFYRSVGVLAVPSLPTPGWLEQFGRVAVEAMACGVPVVASDSGALPDVVAGAGLLVPPGDPDALAAALLRVADEAGLAERLRAAGRERAARCTWDAVADAYLDLYRAAVRSPDADAVGGREPGPGVEVVLVAYGAPELVRRALTPLTSLPVTVVDNSSLPEIAELCRELGVRYLDPGRNGGFAAGVNVGLADRQCPDADVLLLNPDAEVSPADVRTLAAALRAAPDIASVGPAQRDAAGVPARVAWPYPSPGGTWLEAVGLGRLRRGPRFVIGSVLLLRAEALAQVGGFDERFFLYAEETDWAYRASRLGWRHEVVPTVTALHEGAATSTDATQREVRFHASQERYLRKHFGSVGWALARTGQVAGALARAVVLRGERGRAALARAKLYLRGPVRAEASHRGEG